jgi:hypothetical protein
MTNTVEKWRKSTNDVAKEFTRKYFPNERFRLDTFWAGDEIGGVFCVSDMFFDVNRMIESLELKASFDQLYDYANAELNHATSADGDKPTPINFKNYIKYGDITGKLDFN